jgi:bacteriophage lambda tail assembly protein I|uniref:Tail assembly protein n=1 Tax=virus sp. ctn3M15 TaxID=2825821 RepID=A0A8S5RLV2_9VIRU|nr:MAG TPA: tail assembly protein [virus sp. ctn3M15]
MITVCLYGGLRECGRRFDLQVSSPAEAIHALMVQIPMLRKKLMKGFYQVRFGRRDWSEAELKSSFGETAEGILHIVPRVQGAGKNGGIIQTIVGVVIAVVGAYFAQPWAVQLGIGLAVGGVAQMLTKPPKFEGGKGVENSRNSGFSNLSNTAAQGQPMPLAYGRIYCGSRVVSQGIESRRLDGGSSSEHGNSIIRMVSEVAKAKQPAGDKNDPMAVDLTLGMEKSFVSGVAAVAPNGKKYNTDFSNDSVRAANYVATYTVN